MGLLLQHTNMLRHEHWVTSHTNQVPYLVARNGLRLFESFYCKQQWLLGGIHVPWTGKSGALSARYQEAAIVPGPLEAEYAL